MKLTNMTNYIKHIMRTKSVSMSQMNQDYWVYGEVFNETRNRFFLDIGAHDGVYLSNTFLLENRYNWDGICIEANPNTFLKLKNNRNCKCLNKCIDKKNGTAKFALKDVLGGILANDCDNATETNSDVAIVETIRLDELLRQEMAPSVIDYLSIDIEGAEDRALLTFPFEEYVFNCITIERPSVSLRNVLVQNGYIMIKEIPDLDCFFIHSSFKNKYLKNLFQFSKKKFLRKRWE